MKISTEPRKHDTQIAPFLIKRNTDDVAVLLGDEGYDDNLIRTLAQQESI